MSVIVFSGNDFMWFNNNFIDTFFILDVFLDECLNNDFNPHTPVIKCMREICKGDEASLALLNRSSVDVKDNVLWEPIQPEYIWKTAVHIHDIMADIEAFLEDRLNSLNDSLDNIVAFSTNNNQLVVETQ